MDIIRKMLHAVRKFYMIGNKLSVFVAFHFGPAVVNYDIFVSGILKTGRNKAVRRFHNKFFGNIMPVSIPGIPAHGRSFG
ncbi:hypothetical protein SDC9_120848 [bioreactor metagenome]|uniref:Uncharacterized protein n=1 Tax=bioreactor metagenome TaxID=1076179 RepID=A0A645CAB0_9ZZZZ